VRRRSLRCASEFQRYGRVEQDADAPQAPGRIADDEPGAGVEEAGEPDQLAGAGQVDEAQAGQVQAYLAGAAGGKRGQRCCQGLAAGQVGFAGER
jgi:hypothetical protein